MINQVLDSAIVLEYEHPGTLLRDDYLGELGITAYRLAKATGLTPIHVSELLEGKRNITARTALLLGKFFDTSAEFWLNLQGRYDLVKARAELGERLDGVPLYSTTEPQRKESRP